MPPTLARGASGGTHPHSLARVSEDDDGPVLVLILEVLDQVDQVGVLDLLRYQQVALVQLFYCAYSGDGQACFPF